MWLPYDEAFTLADIAKSLHIFIGLGIVYITPFVVVCNFIVALKKRPDERALWTAAAAYAAASVTIVAIAMALGDFSMLLFWLFVPMPGAFIAYYWLRNTYRKGWVEYDEITFGMTIENNDWRFGVLTILGIIGAILLIKLV